ncbi:MAG: hypothetical protein FWE54_03115 [Methanimicrococcus sp.]|nr:hypothetical protein [Methanimicrococcus sp.]
MIYVVFMTVVVIIVSAVLFSHVPLDETMKAFSHSARDRSASPDTDIVLIYPSLFSRTEAPKFGGDLEGEVYKMTYVWKFDDYSHSYRAEIPAELLEYYRARPHDHTEYHRYALSDYDREIIRSFADAFLENGRRHRYTDDQIAMNIITFVYTLPYTIDFETTGFEEYPRYPIETLIEGGDCEDRAILIAALLYELGIESIIIQLDEHAAVGLKDNGNYTGQYYDVNGARYYYAEVSVEGSMIGVIPSHINPKLVALYPLIKKPYVSAEIQHQSAGRNADGNLYRLQGTVHNFGPGEGTNATVRVVTTMSGSSAAPQPDKLIQIGNMPEDSTAHINSLITVPGGSGVVDIYVEGDNFEPILVRGFYFNFR